MLLYGIIQFLSTRPTFHSRSVVPVFKPVDNLPDLTVIVNYYYIIPIALKMVTKIK